MKLGPGLGAQLTLDSVKHLKLQNQKRFSAKALPSVETRINNPSSYGPDTVIHLGREAISQKVCPIQLGNIIVDHWILGVLGRNYQLLEKVTIKRDESCSDIVSRCHIPRP